MACEGLSGRVRVGACALDVRLRRSALHFGMGARPRALLRRSGCVVDGLEAACDAFACLVLYISRVARTRRHKKGCLPFRLIGLCAKRSSYHHRACSTARADPTEAPKCCW